jgi:hypothetical protein
MCRHGGSIVYQLVTADGTVALTGWGPAGDPLKPIKHVPEGKIYALAVESGRLRVRDVLGRAINRLDAVRIVNALAPPGEGRYAQRTAIYRRGGVKYVPTLTAAADFLGITRQNLLWQVHRLPNLVIFHAHLNRA